MKLGTENRTKVILAAVLGVVALMLVRPVHDFGDSESAAGSVSQASARGSDQLPASGTAHHWSKSRLALRPHRRLIQLFGWIC